MGKMLGYALGSLRTPDVSEQVDILTAAGVNVVFSDALLSVDGERPEFERLMARAKAGDTIVVARIDRLARNTKHFLHITQDLNRKGVCLKVLGIQLDTATEHGQLMLSMLGAVADFERSVLLERQKEGIEKAKLAGKFKGRKATARAKADKVMKLLEKGLTRQQVADKLKIGVASVYRILRAAKQDESVNKKVVVSSKKVLSVDSADQTKTSRASSNKKNPETSSVSVLPDDQLSLF